MYVTFLSSSLDRDDDRLKIEGYDLRRSDDPSGLKKAVACIYYKEHIPIIRRDDLCSPSNGLVTEIRLENEKCFPTCSYRSPSQNQHEFENFFTNVYTLMDYINNELPTCSVLTGDFNSRYSKWSSNDITNANGRAHDTLTSSVGYKQIINDPTHPVNNSFSCIDLIFCDNLNICTNYGVDLSIFEKCHHNTAKHPLIHPGRIYGQKTNLMGLYLGEGCLYMGGRLIFGNSIEKAMQMVVHLILSHHQ